jgi:hypothetical protein
MNAREPDELLFERLPVACGCAPFRVAGERTASQVNTFADRMSKALSELGFAFGALRRELLGHLFEIDGSRSSRLELGGRARAVLSLPLESGLKPFVNALGDTELDDDGWLDNIGMIVTGKPMPGWTDDDVQLFRSRLSERLQLLHRLEAINFERLSCAVPNGSATRVTITQANGAELSRVIRVDTIQADNLRGIAERLITEAAEVVGDRVQAELGILAALLAQGPPDA